MDQKKTLFAAVFFFLSCFLAYAQPPQQEILIGLIPEKNIFQQHKKYSLLAEYLKNKTGISVKLTSLSRYGNIIDSFNKEKMDGAFFGSFTGALAYEKLDVELLVRPMTPTGKTIYHGHIFVRKDSGIRNARDMKGKTMAFVEKASSCGYIYPLAYLRENGIKDYRKHFSEYYFAGSHDAVIDAVLQKKADVGVAKDTVYDEVARRDPRIYQELLILAESPPFPAHGLFLRKSLPASLTGKIRDALLQMDQDPEGRGVLESFGAAKFVAADANTDYKTVFEVARKAGIDLKTYNYRNQ